MNFGTKTKMLGRNKKFLEGNQNKKFRRKPKILEGNQNKILEENQKQWKENKKFKNEI